LAMRRRATTSKWCTPQMTPAAKNDLKSFTMFTSLKLSAPMTRVVWQDRKGTRTTETKPAGPNLGADELAPDMAWGSILVTWMGCPSSPRHTTLLEVQRLWQRRMVPCHRFWSRQRGLWARLPRQKWQETVLHRSPCHAMARHHILFITQWSSQIRCPQFRALSHFLGTIFRKLSRIMFAISW
jgi:hypothetical protein